MLRCGVLFGQVKVVVTLEDEDRSRHQVLLPQALVTNDVRVDMLLDRQ